MKLDILISALEQLRKTAGGDAGVFVIDDEGEYDFSIHTDLECIGDPPRMVIYLDVADDGSGAEQRFTDNPVAIALLAELLAAFDDAGVYGWLCKKQSAIVNFACAIGKARKLLE